MAGKKYYMTQQTLTDKIFALTAPYDNEYQGKFPRVLFVCSAGILRSATAAAVAGARGINARAAGSAKYALIPVSVNLIEWAKKIVFVNPDNFEQVLRTFENTGYTDDIKQKAIVWNIPDNFEYMHPTLVQEINAGLDELMKVLPVDRPGYVGKTAWDL